MKLLFLLYIFEIYVRLHMNYKFELFLNHKKVLFYVGAKGVNNMVYTEKNYIKHCSYYFLVIFQCKTVKP